MPIEIGTAEHAKFAHEAGIGLRMQAFLRVKDKEGRLACVRLEDDPESWLLPGELLRLNEDPKEAAKRVAGTWFETPLEPRLADVINLPATSPEDNKWYLIFVFEVDAPDGLKGTPDTLEVKFVAPGEPPGPFGLAHEDVFQHLT